MKKVVYKKASLKSKSTSKIDSTYPSTKNKKKIYRIVWRDAFTEVDIWHDPDTISDKDYLCETVGYLITESQNKHYYTIASTITSEGFFCSIINIPKNMVVKKQLIRMEL